MALSQSRAQAIWEAWRNDPNLADFFDPNDQAASVASLSMGGKVLVGGFGEARATRLSVTAELRRCDIETAEESSDRRIEIEVIPAAD